MVLIYMLAKKRIKNCIYSKIIVDFGIFIHIDGLVLKTPKHD